MTLRIFLTVAFVGAAFSMGCGSSHSDADSQGSSAPPIQKTYGVRGAHDVASFIAVTTGIKVNIDNNNGISGAWDAKSPSLCSVGSLNAKCVQAFFDINYLVFLRLADVESQLAANTRKWFGVVDFTVGIGQFNEAKKNSLAETILTRLMGAKPNADEIAAVVTTFTAILSVTGPPTTKEALTVLCATVASSTLGGVSR